MGQAQRLDSVNKNGDSGGQIAQFGGIVAAGFIAAVLLLYGFAWIANQVLEQETTAIDNATLNFLQKFASPQLTLAAQIVSLLGSEVVLAVTALALIILAWQRLWDRAFTLVLVTGGAEVLNNILKNLFHRTRPTPVIGLLDAQQFSFPSGHAMVSAAFYFYIAYLTWRLVHGFWRWVLVGGLILLVLLIGLSRIYLEVHYLSDVIAGNLAGFLWTDAVILGRQALTSRRAANKAPSPALRAASPKGRGKQEGRIS